MHSAITIQAPEVTEDPSNRTSIKNAHLVLFLLVVVVSLAGFYQSAHKRQEQLQHRLRETVAEAEALKT